MSELRIVEGYHSPLSIRETQKAIKFVKDEFQKELISQLKLERISAPIVVTHESGINDDLNGVERKVSFDLSAFPGEMEIVQSLAKWKRMALHKYGFTNNEGLYTDMNAIRRDDHVDNIHSIFVDQWDWEKIIDTKIRNTEYLKETVIKIVNAIATTKEKVNKEFPCLKFSICKDVFFITTQELEDLYPDLSPKEREMEIVKKHKTVFLMQIGSILRSGIKHDGRAPDYDDWHLNGDILFWNEILQEPLEISSMGIRVDKNTLIRQLKETHTEERLQFPYHQAILNDILPLTIGGGIGQSRLCMLLLEKLHIGEIHASVWPKEDIAKCEQHGINLL